MTIDFSKTADPKLLQEFSDFVINQTRETGFRISSRGWCYIFEQEGLITKSQFDKVVGWISMARKRGYLPVDIVPEESNRSFQGVEKPAEVSPVTDAYGWLKALRQAPHHYDVDWWRDEEHYVQMIVEKVDLVTLFEPICKEYHIPIANGSGWSSILQRAEYARRFKEAEDRGMSCTLLYCGDHDPAGLLISDNLRKNLQDIAKVEWEDGCDGYDPQDLEIVRFGLNSDFIEEHGFTWIDNLETGGGKDLSDPSHRHHTLPHVQQYLENYGARKCEANVLVTNPGVARDLCRTAITDVVGEDAIDRFKERRKEVVDYFDAWASRSGVRQAFDDIESAIDDEDEYVGDMTY